MSNILFLSNWFWLAAISRFFNLSLFVMSSNFIKFAAFKYSHIIFFVFAVGSNLKSSIVTLDK